MSAEMEDSTSVVGDLFEEMDQTVTAYGPGVVRVDRCVNGTAFYPGGIGLWRGITAMGAAPRRFPDRPVMILGHNFDSAARLDLFCRNGIEPMGVGTWLMLREYLRLARLRPEDCFFSNIYLGLQPLASRGELKGSDIYKKQCREFLHYQVARTKPSLIAVLGIPARDEFDLSGCETNHVKLDHPSYAAACGATHKRELVLTGAVTTLSDALDAHCAHLVRPS
jgi:hypothetical protein